MKRRAKEMLVQPPSKITPRLNEKFEFLELSICAASTTANVKSERHPKTARNAPQKLAVAEVKRTDFREPITMEKFQEFMSSIGRSVKKVRIVNGNSAILPSVQEHCDNLNRIELLEGEGSLPLRDFRNLTEMKLPNVRIATNAFRKCLVNNPDLESLEYDHYWYENEFQDLPVLLPNLRSLQLGNVTVGAVSSALQSETPSDDSVVLQLLKSDTLTKFSFESTQNCNRLLSQLSSKPNLEELHVTMSVTLETYKIIGLLENLTFLAITNSAVVRKIAKPPIIWPPKLTRLKLSNILMSDDDLLSIVEQLHRLEELHIGTTTADKYPWLHDRTISEIENKVKVGKSRRVLKIFFSEKDAADENPYKHKSAHLEIINENAKEKVDPLHITIAC